MEKSKGRGGEREMGKGREEKGGREVEVGGTCVMALGGMDALIPTLGVGTTSWWVRCFGLP